MKRRKIVAEAVAQALLLCGAFEAQAVDWPVVRRFDAGHLYRVGLPMGGIGTGSVSLSGRGELCDWEIMNIPNKGKLSGECNGIDRSFFAIRAKGATTEMARMLAGPLEHWEYLSSEGRPAPQSGLPRFSDASFDAAFPFGTVHLSDAALPVKVDVRGFSPFIPGDSAASSLPVASLEYIVENTSDEPLEVSVVGFVRNLVGNNGYPRHRDWKSFEYAGGEKDNHTTYCEGAGLKGVLCWSSGVATNDDAWGSLALATPDAEGSVTSRACCTPDWWNNAILDFWDDFTDDGELSPRTVTKDSVPSGGLCIKKAVPAHGKTSFRFAYTWTFPNRRAWSPTIVGNWYSQFYTNAWAAAEKIVPRLPELEERTLAFVRGVLAEKAPDEIKEAALSNLAVLKSQTVFRLPSGHLMGWEGSFDHTGSCQGSCTHVWNYENAVASLFPDLARSMRDVEFNYAMDPKTGRMDFRARLPLGTRGGGVAADGQMGCIMKAYRDWRLAGADADAWLKGIWPKVRKGLEFAWTEWDRDRDGLMEGSQHNTMDVNYWGPNPQMQFWYLGALRAAEEMAKAVGDAEFAATCRTIFEKGSKGTDEQLFNGEYYEHKIREDHANDRFQLGKGCLVDQLVGQQMAHLWGLGDLAAAGNLRKACESVWRYNWLPDFSGHFTNMRVYCTGKESGLLMASWPRGRLKVPFPYFSEVMTGFEYVAAAEMIFQGMDDEALRVVRAIRARHDGLKRNPFSEPECGHNYARSMASWNCLLAWKLKHQ